MLGDEILNRDLAALGEELPELANVHDLVLNAEGVLEAAKLRQTHVDRHLATLEAGSNLVTGLGALGATASGLTLRTLTATHAGLRGLGSGGRTQVVQLNDLRLLRGVRHCQSTSSAVTR